jgi:2'-5' RNA ligase
MEQIRSFIAIELSGELKGALTRLQEQLKSGSRAPVKWVDAGGIHLTLKFLGNIDAGMTGKITRAMEEAVRGVSPFKLGVKGLGVFPSLKRVQVVWVGLSGDIDRLKELQQSIDASLFDLGFARESRSFTAHLTLARVRDRATPEERENLGQLVASTGFETGCSLEVDSVQLMRSQLTREGAIYSRISSIALK